MAFSARQIRVMAARHNARPALGSPARHDQRAPPGARGARRPGAGTVASRAPRTFRRAEAVRPVAQRRWRRPTARWLTRYLGAMDTGRPAQCFVAPARDGRPLLLFRRPRRLQLHPRDPDVLPAALARMAACARDPALDRLYLGSVPLTMFPGFARDNALPGHTRGGRAAHLAGQSFARLAGHFDTFDNLACVVAGRRRFTLFIRPMPSATSMSGRSTTRWPGNPSA